MSDERHAEADFELVIEANFIHNGCRRIAHESAIALLRGSHVSPIAVAVVGKLDVREFPA